MQNKVTKLIAIGLFVVAMLLNVSVFVDSGNAQKADVTMSELNVNLFQKAYAGETDHWWNPCDGNETICINAGWFSIRKSYNEYWLRNDTGNL